MGSYDGHPQSLSTLRPGRRSGDCTTTRMTPRDRCRRRWRRASIYEIHDRIGWERTWTSVSLTSHSLRRRARSQSCSQAVSLRVVPVHSTNVEQMDASAFPRGFLWATATHQVEGGNRNNDRWAWEHDPASWCVEPSGGACDHPAREDIGFLAEVGFSTCRFER